MQKGINNKLVIGLLAHVDSGKTTDNYGGPAMTTGPRGFISLF